MYKNGSLFLCCICAAIGLIILIGGEMFMNDTRTSAQSQSFRPLNYYSATYTANGLPGVTLITAQNPNFAQTVQSISVRGGIVETLPHFTAAVRNDSGRRIIGLRVRWEITDLNGNTIIHRDDISPNSALDKQGFVVYAGRELESAIEVGQTRLFTFNGHLAQATRLPDLNQDENDAVNQSKEALSRISEQAAAVEVQVDGVFYEDGKFFGPNKSFFFEQTLGHLEGERDFAIKMRDAVLNPQTNFLELADEMQTLVKHNFDPHPTVYPRDGAEAYNAIRHWVFYRHAREFIAMREGFTDREIANQLSQVRHDLFTMPTRGGLR